MVAITHFDQYYEPRTGTLNENPDGNTVKQHVSQAIKGVKEDDVFPVCGKWVLNAHLLKKLPTDSNIQLVVRHAYENYMQKTTDSSSVSEQSIMIDTVLKMGGLKKLEERYSMINCIIILLNFQLEYVSQFVILTGKKSFLVRLRSYCKNHYRQQRIY